MGGLLPFLQEIRRQQREANKYTAVFPCRLKILPECIFNARDPIVLGVHIVEGQLKEGSPLCIPNKGFLDVGVVASLEYDHNMVETAKKGQDVCIKIAPVGGEKKMFGRHFDENDELVSKVRSWVVCVGYGSITRSLTCYCMVYSSHLQTAASSFVSDLPMLESERSGFVSSQLPRRSGSTHGVSGACLR